MKVTGNNTGSQLQSVNTSKSKDVNDTGKNKKSDSSLQSNLLGSVKLNVSDRAQSMQKAKEIASDQSVDSAKVAHYQKLIDDGKYFVNSSDIADKLVDEQLGFLE